MAPSPTKFEELLSQFQIMSANQPTLGIDSGINSSDFDRRGSSNSSPVNSSSGNSSPGNSFSGNSSSGNSSHKNGDECWCGAGTAGSNQTFSHPGMAEILKVFNKGATPFVPKHTNISPTISPSDNSRDYGANSSKDFQTSTSATKRPARGTLSPANTTTEIAFRELEFLKSKVNCLRIEINSLEAQNLALAKEAAFYKGKYTQYKDKYAQYEEKYAQYKEKYVKEKKKNEELTAMVVDKFFDENSSNEVVAKLKIWVDTHALVERETLDRVLERDNNCAIF